MRLNIRIKKEKKNLSKIVASEAVSITCDDDEQHKSGGGVSCYYMYCIASGKGSDLYGLLTPCMYIYYCK